MFNTISFIAEVRSHPVLYRKPDESVEPESRRQAWFKVAEAVFSDWGAIGTSESYERVLELQKKWKHIRDGYNRELRVRDKAKKEGVRSRQTYIYYRQLKFLKGDNEEVSSSSDDDPLILGKRSRKMHTAKKRAKVSKRAKIKDEAASPDNEDQEEEELSEQEVEPSFNNVEFSEEMQVEVQGESDSDRMFLLSFLPEMQGLPAHVRMWARAQISKVMQDAVAYCCHGKHGQLPTCSGAVGLNPDAVPDRSSLRSLKIQRDRLDSN